MAAITDFLASNGLQFIGRQDYVETLPDEGDIDLLRVVQILRETGYDGMVVPDHTPQTPGMPERLGCLSVWVQLGNTSGRRTPGLSGRVPC